jgi:hypothetical protein
MDTKVHAILSIKFKFTWSLTLNRMAAVDFNLKIQKTWYFSFYPAQTPCPPPPPPPPMSATVYRTDKGAKKYGDKLCSLGIKVIAKVTSTEKDGK